MIDLIFSNFVPLACVIIAGILAFNGIYGWGYFLFVAFLTMQTYTKVKYK